MQFKNNYTSGLMCLKVANILKCQRHIYSLWPIKKFDWEPILMLLNKIVITGKKKLKTPFNKYTN